LPTGSFPITQNSFAESSATTRNGYISSRAVSSSSPLSSSPYSFQQIASRNDSAKPLNLGADHPTQNYVGYAGGIMNTYEVNSNLFTHGIGPAFIVTNASGSPKDVSLALTNGSSLEAIFNLTAQGVTAPPTDATFSANAFKAAQLRFGNPPTLPNGSPGDGTRGAYVDSRTFAALSERSFDVNNMANNGETSKVNGMGFNGPPNSSGSRPFLHSAMVVSDVVGANTQSFLSSISPSTVTPCQCDYTRWGFWSSVDQRLDIHGGRDLFFDAGHLGVWVAGLPARVTDIPTTGSATYTGHTIADISNNGSQYVAAGTFSNTVNFGSRNGIMQIGNLDGSTYGGTVGWSAGATTFAGMLNTGPSSRFMQVNGSFFQGAASPYGEMGGSITITGPNNYLGSGVFVGRKP
jgi:hypothetical protein